VKPRPPAKRKIVPRSAPSRSLVWTARALADLESIGDYIAQENPSAAERWVVKLMGLGTRAAKLPLAGRRVPELARDDIRELGLKSYRLVYLVRADRVDVLTVFEGHQRLRRDLGR
jgi:toxin ParE1/3/4